MNKNIGDMTESELKDFIIELNEKLSRKERIIDKEIELLQNSQIYIGRSNEKTLFVRLIEEEIKILNGDEKND